MEVNSSYNRENYYQNMYNMFGGYNPVTDKQASSLRRLGMLAGTAMILYILMQKLFIFLLSITNAVELYRQDAVYMNGLNIFAQVLYILVPFLIVFLLSKPGERAKMIIFEKPANTLVTVYAVFTGIAICVVSNFASGLITSLFSVLGVDFLSGSEDMPMPKNIIGIILMVLCNAVVAPLLEEFAFRGVLLQPLRKHGDRFAIVVSALIFGLMHGNMVQAPFAFIVGLALGYFCVATGSIWTSVAIHSLNNLWATLFSIYSESQSEIDGVVYYAIQFILLAIGIVAFIDFRKHNTFKMKKVKSGMNRNLRLALYLCTPTVVIGISDCIYSTITLQNTTSLLGLLVLVALIIVIGVFVSRGTKLIQTDTRLTQSKLYSVSKVMTAVFVVLGIIATVIFATSSMLSGITGN